jgi:hypothetical protein
MKWMVKYPKHGLRMAELWLDAPIERPPGCDLLMLRQYSQLPPHAVGWPFTTLTISLQGSEEQLLEGLNRDTKYKVRRAASKDQVECLYETEGSAALCAEFLAFYNDFAQAKGLPGLPAAELLARAQGGALCISRAVREGVTLVWHVHAVTPHKATLLHSASQFRQLDDNEARAVVGRANRLLHWRDMLTFKEQGMSVYDFGGWYAGEQNEDLLRINQFKEGFGGVRTEQFNAGIALSWRGWIYLKLRQHFSEPQRRAMRAKILGLASLRGSH